MRSGAAQDQIEYVPLVGGMDTETAPLAVYPGRALDMLNFEPDTNGGYRRMYGYEAFDGSPAPSAAAYSVIEVVDNSGFTVGATVTGGTSFATGVVLATNGTTSVVLTAITGVFESGETIGSSTSTSATAPNGAPTWELDAAWDLLAENHYRADIAALPGDGPVRGVWRLGSVVYAWRDDNTDCKLYKSTATGWSVVAYSTILLFDAGTAAVAEGATLTGATSGASATVRRVVYYTGTFGGSDAAGYFVLSGVTSGPYQNNENLQVGGITKCLANGASYTHTQTEGGRYEFVNHNFYGSSTTYRAYGCDGVNPAFEFDGTYFCPILLPTITGAPALNTPSYVEAHKGHLFLAFANGSLQHSVQGEPLTFDGFLGAEEFGLGADITGIKSLSGGVLAAHTRRKTFALYGNNGADWVLTPIAETAGALPRTVQQMGQSYFLDDLGVFTLARVQAFGDFKAGSLSGHVQHTVDSIRDTVIASLVVRKSNQYRIFSSSGKGVLFFLNTKGLLEASRFEYRDAPVCVYNCEDENGDEHIYFGDSTGWVYEAEIGNNQDGEAMAWYTRLPFNSLKTPRLRKSFRDVQFELEATRGFSMRVSSEMDYGSAENQSQSVFDTTVNTGAGGWDTSSWDEYFWDPQTIPSVRIPFTGTGNNISLLISGSSATVQPFTLQGLLIRYRVRRLDRG